MKVIDLLNKIANGEEVPKFMIDGEKYCIGDDGYLEDGYGRNVDWYIFKDWLNEEVKIIEEEKDIEELTYGLSWDGSNLEGIEEALRNFSRVIFMNKDKINELVREVNKLRNQNEK